ncbi:transglycosylase SLT domain-containing protein [Roseinatronobacter sp.]|uniref:transglycosylase SLT domain-containing protein n=1 Tax=Roseinatronobacter sp. TaxID=1945755 RepID=UPI0025DB352A|nr:transglycosylase SLT domain-containing protein [Rhodobaca sp.]
MAGFFDHTDRNLVQRVWFAALVLILANNLLWFTSATASQPAALCENAAQQAATRHGVPLDVLRAVALVETGRARAGQLEPWPWAIHSAGRGHWFESRAEATAYAKSRLNAGHRNVDLGCFQINYRWHGEKFASIDAMMDPIKNADYAARLLAAHKTRLGAWDLAAGAYHSATPHLAQRYIARFREMRAQTGLGRQDHPQPTRTRSNQYSLLTPAGGAKLGSLVQTNGMDRGVRLIDLSQGQP